MMTALLLASSLHGGVSLGFRITTQWSNYGLNRPQDATFRGSVATLTALIGYRWAFSPWCMAVGIGGGGYRERIPQTGTSGPGDPGRATYAAIPDGLLGAGLDF